MGCIQTQGELDALVAALNRKGTRERVLLNVLRRKYRAIADAFEEGAYANLAEVDRSVKCARDSVLLGAARAASSLHARSMSCTGGCLCSAAGRHLAS